MQILLLNQYAGSPGHGMEFRPYFMAREWLSAGHRVRIVAASESHVRNKPVLFDGNYSIETLDDIEYCWLRTPPYQGNGAARARNILTFVWRIMSLMSTAVLKNFQPDVVIASSTHPLDIYPARRIARRCDARLIYEVHDLWPLSPIELSGMSPRHPFIMLLQHAENYACCHANKVVSMLPKADGHLLEHGMAPGKFVYIPNGIHANNWHEDTSLLPEQHRRTLDELRAAGRFIVGYAGAHGLANALQHLIYAAEMTRDLPISYVLVGQGPEKSGLINLAQSKGLENVVFLEPVAKGVIPTLLTGMDALYIGLQRRALFRFGVSPNKLMDYMMAARPVIQAIKAGNDLVADSGCGVTIPPEDPGAIAEAVQSILNMSREERRRMGDRGHDYITAKHDYPVLAQRFLEAMSP